MTEARFGRPSGVVVPLHTAFGGDRGLDYEGVCAEVARAEALGVGWVLVGGVTGEWPSLSLNEREALLDSACGARNRMRVLAHATATTADETDALLKHAERVGADAAMLSAPIVSSVAEEDAVSYIRTVAQGTSLPVVIYNNAPGTSGPLSPGAIAKLAETPNIVGIKDSGRDARAFADMRALAPKLSLLCGEGDLFAAWLALGADGGIVIPALVDTERTLAYYRAACEGDVVTARDLWRELWRLISVLGLNARPLPMTKLALELQGRPASVCRPPLPAAVSPKARDALAEVSAELGLLSSARVARGG